MLVDGISSISSKKHKRWRGRVVNECRNTGLTPALSNAPSPPPPTRAVSVACRHCSIPISCIISILSRVGEANPSCQHLKTALPSEHHTEDDSLWDANRCTVCARPRKTCAPPAPLVVAEAPCRRCLPLSECNAACTRVVSVSTSNAAGLGGPLLCAWSPPNAHGSLAPGQPSDVGQAAQAIKGLSSTRRGHRSAPPAPHPPQ